MMDRVELLTIGNLRMVIGTPDMLGLVDHRTSPRTTQETVTTLRRAGVEVFAAVDGPMFEFCANERARDYDDFQCGTARFAHYYPARAIDVPSREAQSGIAVIVRNGRAVGARGDGGPRTPDETFRVQAYPSLVIDGAKTQGLRDVDTNKRPAIGILSDGRVFLALSPRITMPELADVLAGLRLPGGATVTWAGYLDGGGSAALYVDTTLDGTPEYNYNLNGRRVVTWVTLERKTGQPPTLSERARNVLAEGAHQISTDPRATIALLLVCAAILAGAVAAARASA